MTVRQEDIPFLSTLRILLTYRCTISCPHCMLEAGPRREKKMALGDVLGWIDDAAAYREGAIRSIEFTGGEPFYDLQTLALVTDHAMNAGLSVSVVTNASWARTIEEAILMLNQLPAIKTISISTDVYHQQFIPIGHVHNAIIAAELLGRGYDVTVTTDDLSDEQYRLIMASLDKIIDPGRIKTSVALPVGRARKNSRMLRHRITPEPATSACATSGRPIILPDGRVMACSVPIPRHQKSCLLCLGNLRRDSLETVLDRAATNPLLRLLRIWGPHRLISLLQAHGHGDLLPKEYIYGSHCDICNRLLSDRHIAARLAEILDEPESRAVIAVAVTAGNKLMSSDTVLQSEA